MLSRITVSVVTLTCRILEFSVAGHPCQTFGIVRCPNFCPIDSMLFPIFILFPLVYIFINKKVILIKHKKNVFSFHRSLKLLTQGSVLRVFYTGPFLFVYRQCGKRTNRMDFTSEMESVESTTFSYTENPTRRRKREKYLKEILEQKDYKWRKK